jgi:hypothetical protein
VPADDDDVAADLGRAGPLVPVRVRAEARAQVDATLVAEGRHGSTGARIQRDQVLAADHVETPCGPFGPGCDPARAVASKPLPGIVGKRCLHPERPSSPRMKRLDQPDTVRAVQDAVNHERRRPEVPE